MLEQTTKVKQDISIMKSRRSMLYIDKWWKKSSNCQKLIKNTNLLEYSKEKSRKSNMLEIDLKRSWQRRSWWKLKMRSGLIGRLRLIKYGRWYLNLILWMKWWQVQGKQKIKKKAVKMIISWLKLGFQSVRIWLKKSFRKELKMAMRLLMHFLLKVWVGLDHEL